MEASSLPVDLQNLSAILNGMIAGSPENFLEFSKIYEKSLAQLGNFPLKCLSNDDLVTSGERKQGNRYR